MWQHCAHAAVMFRHKKHLAEVGKTSCFSLKYLFRSPQTQLAIHRGLIRNSITDTRGQIAQLPVGNICFLSPWTTAGIRPKDFLKKYPLGSSLHMLKNNRTQNFSNIHLHHPPPLSDTTVRSQTCNVNVIQRIFVQIPIQYIACDMYKYRLPAFYLRKPYPCGENSAVPISHIE